MPPLFITKHLDFKFMFQKYFKSIVPFEILREAMTNLQSFRLIANDAEVELRKINKLKNSNIYNISDVKYISSHTKYLQDIMIYNNSKL